MQDILEVVHRLRECHREHEFCPHGKTHPLPTMVLDLNPQHPKLHISAPNEQGMYAALSYCWGGSQVTTTKDTLQAHITGIALQTLSQTIQDAIYITRKLCIRYLWVDALCIVQDDEISISKEIDRMGRIYSNATLTISAASATCAAEGFLRTPATPRGCELPFLLPDSGFGKVLVVPSRENKGVAFKKMKGIDTYPIGYRDWTNQEMNAFLLEGIGKTSGVRPAELSRPWPLDTRAWALQEHMLSPRLLVFGPDDIRWRCQEIELEPLFPSPIRYRGPAQGLPLLRAPALDHGSKYWTKERITIGGFDMTKQRDLWCNIMVDFSNRSITFRRDRLSALAGIASHLKELWGGQYVAGYWVECLPAQLAWVQQLRNQGNTQLRDDVEEYLAPSWSWITAKQPIKFENLSHVTARVISAVAEPLLPEARYGRLKSGTLTLSAAVLRKDPMARPHWDEKMDDGVRMNDGIILMKLGLRQVSKRKAIIGLVLRPADRERYRRAGVFYTENVKIWQSGGTEIAPRITVTII